MTKKQAFSFVIVLFLLVVSAERLGAAEPSAKSPDGFKVAAVQFNPRIYRLQENVGRLYQVFEKAARRGTR